MTGTIESGLFRSERYGVELRTTDPASHDEGDRWVRTDIAPETDQLATYRFDMGDLGVVDVPIFDSAATVDGVEKVRRIPIGGTVGFIPFTADTAAFPRWRHQHDGAVLKAHDALAVSAIPDSGLLHRFDPSELSGFDDGDPVSTRPDLEGSDDLSGSGTYRESLIGGLPGIEYNGSSNDHSGAFDSAISPPYVVFIVANITVTSDDDGLFSGESNIARVYDPSFNSAGDWRINTPNGNIAFSDGGGADKIYAAEFDNTSTVWVNDTEVVSGDAGAPADLDGLTIANREDGGGEAEMAGGEVLVYDPTAPGYSRSEVFAYLNGRWR